MHLKTLPGNQFPVGKGFPAFFIIGKIMSLDTQAHAFIKSVIHNHVGKNIRQYKWTSWTGEVKHNMLGGISSPVPCEGKAVEIGEVFTLVKVTNNSFAIVLNELLSEPVSQDDKIGLSFYKLKRFDGTAADGSEDPAVGMSRTFMLTGVKTLFPVKWEGRYLCINSRFEDQYTQVRNPYLRDLITQMEVMPVNGGRRCVVNVLVDANAKNLSFNDPTEEDSPIDPPAIRADVETAKFTGAVEISYNRACDTYAINFRSVGDAGQIIEDKIEDVHFDELGAVLIDKIDDGQWLKAKVTMIKPAPKKRVKSPTVQSALESI